MKNTKTGETKVVHEVIGPVETTYKFNGLCDFQYLPMVKNSDTEGFDSIKEKIVLNRLPSTKGQLISKCPFGVFKSPKKPTISALDFKKRSNQKSNVSQNNILRLVV